eukprot:GHVU01097674.1.p3 GENE.GHVU01097674.1~~GHVU01097674.1.p3  ORF type:complete len:105 (+),score=14.04 GHVU01097674.1:71-385(+)
MVGIQVGREGSREGGSALRARIWHKRPQYESINKKEQNNRRTGRKLVHRHHFMVADVGRAAAFDWRPAVAIFILAGVYFASSGNPITDKPKYFPPEIIMNMNAE